MTLQIRVELDEDLLLEVQSILGTRTIRETIEVALREVIRSQARREEVRVSTTMEGMDLAESIGTKV